jgi:hypothetical protein
MELCTHHHSHTQNHSHSSPFVFVPFWWPKKFEEGSSSEKMGRKSTGTVHHYHLSPQSPQTLGWRRSAVGSSLFIFCFSLIFLPFSAFFLVHHPNFNLYFLYDPSLFFLFFPSSFFSPFFRLFIIIIYYINNKIIHEIWEWVREALLLRFHCSHYFYVQTKVMKII